MKRIDIVIIGAIVTIMYALLESDPEVLIVGMLFISLFVCWVSVIPWVRAKLSFLEIMRGAHNDY